jgi:PadR family transcriptional regulator PadR
MSDAPYLGEFEELVLLAVARLQDDEQRAGRSVSIGAVYATIERLTTKGFLKTHLKSEAGTRARRFFTLTPSAVRALVAGADFRARMWAGLQLKGAGRP